MAVFNQPGFSGNTLGIYGLDENNNVEYPQRGNLNIRGYFSNHFSLKAFRNVLRQGFPNFSALEGVVF